MLIARTHHRRFLTSVFAFALLIPALTACGLIGDGLAADELPEEITSEHRDDIEETVETFLDGVNRYNPQVASAAMLLPRDLGIPDVARMVVEIGALEAVGHEIALLSIGAISVSPSGGFVSAVAVTSGDPIEFRLVRRDGQWRIARVPDVLASVSLPYAIEWEVTNIIETAETIFAVGTITNAGQQSLLHIGVGGYARGVDGRVQETQISPLVPKPSIAPGETTYFRFAFTIESVLADRVVVVPNTRALRPDDLNRVVSALDVTPTEVSVGESVPLVTLVNGSTQSADAFLVAVGTDATGRVLDVNVSAAIGLNGGESLEQPLPPLEAAGVTSISAMVWGIVRDGQ